MTRKRGGADAYREAAAREADAVRREYARRATDPTLAAYYQRVGSALERSLRSRRERTLSILDALGPRRSLRVLDFGCGTGADLGYLSLHGFDLVLLVGVDLLPDTLARARADFPGMALAVANGSDLPFGDGAFDAALQTTALSSIVDATVRARVAREIARVTRVGGLIISYDVRIVSDGNSRLVPIDRGELRRLFAGAGSLKHERAGLHLGIGSRLPAPLAAVASRLPPLLRAYLAVVRRGDGSAERERVAATYASYAQSGHDRRWYGASAGDALMAEERERWIVNALGDRARGVVLDVGSGDANVARAIERRRGRPQRYVGVDLLPERVADARRRTHWAALVVGDARRLPLPDGCADAAVASTLLSSLVDPLQRSAVAAEVARVVRPGGRFVVYDVRYPSPSNRRIRPVSRAELGRLFAGWRLVEAQTLTVLPPLARSWLSAGARRYAILSRVPILRSHLGVVLERPR